MDVSISRWTSRRAALVAAGALLPANSLLPAGALLPTNSLLPTPSLPAIGLGTCCDEYDASYATALKGLSTGFRLLDTAAHYASEPAVGDAMVEARRLDLLGSSSSDAVRHVTKIWFDDMGYEQTLASAKQSMANLHTDQLDILLIHFPGSVDAVQSPSRNRKLREDTWRALETLLADGRCRRIGVSNWTRRHLKETLQTCSVRPSVLQTELHPRLPQVELVEYARETCGIETIMAHCPLAHGAPALLNDPNLKRLADARGDGCTPAQLCLRWSIDKGFLPIPKASSEARLRENLRAASMPPLSADERRAIDALESFGSDARVSFDPGLIA